jgi:hypothetical protein
MDVKRKIALGVATLAVAIGAGHLVQGGFDRAIGAGGAAGIGPKLGNITPVFASVRPPPNPAIVAAAAVSPQSAGPAADPAFADPGAVPADGPVRALPRPAPRPPTLAAARTAIRPGDPRGGGCALSLDVVPAPDAALAVTLRAPCAPLAPVVLEHAGLSALLRTSGGGSLAVTLPALSADGRVRARLADGATAEAAAAVDLGGVRRVAVTWSGHERLALHASENGVALGAPGYLWFGAAPAALDAAEGRFVRLGLATGEQPRLADVYTFPADPAVAVELMIEAEVAPATCGRTVSGVAILSQSGEIETAPVQIAMPPCDGMGGFLVLSYPLPPTTLAAAN